MIKKILIAFFSLIILSQANAQFPGLSLGYIKDYGLGRNPFLGRGFHIGTGVENITSKFADGTYKPGLVFSIRLNVDFTNTPTTTLLDSIPFDLEENVPNLGFAEGKYNRLTWSIESDFGYGEVFEPFISFGFVHSMYASRVNYQLYTPIDCGCPTKNFFSLANSAGSGFLTGIGLKIKPTNKFIFDFRLIYSGIWLNRKDENVNIPDLSSLTINDYGEPVVNYMQSSFAQNFMIRAGIIFQLPENSNYQPNYSEDDKEDSDDDYTPGVHIDPNWNSTTPTTTTGGTNTTVITPSTNQKKECAPLVPASRKRT